MQIINREASIVKAGLLLFFLMGGLVGKSQDGYKKVDSTMYHLYQAHEWKNVVQYGKSNELDYYYFNIRMGDSFFALKQYLSAEKYYKKASLNNETEYVKENLFWTYLYMGERELAEHTFNELSIGTQEKTGYTKETLVQFYGEFGVKISSVDTIGNLYYSTLFLKHRIGKNVMMNYSYTPFTLKSDIFEATNQQFNVSGSYFISGKTILSVGGMFSSMDFTEHFVNKDVPSDNEFIIVDEITKGRRKYTTNSYYLNYYHRVNRWKLNINMNFITQNQDKNELIVKKSRSKFNGFPFADQVQESDTIIKESVIIPSFGLSYAPSIFKDRVSLGVVLFAPKSKGNFEIVVKPTISALITNKLWVEASYFEVSEHLFADYTTNILYNTSQPTKRFLSTVSYMFTPKFVLKGTYSYESVQNLSYGFDYTLNAAYLGLQINL